jgi:hypothetical protein
VRGPANAENLLIYSHAPMNKELIDRRLRALGKRLGIRLHPHRLRHTAATELINANCELTTIQKVLGHKSLDTTLRYARAHDQTVADNFYAAMERVDEALAIESEEVVEDAPLCPEDVKVQVLEWIEQLSCEDIAPADRRLAAESLKRALFRDLPGAGLPAG